MILFIDSDLLENLVKTKKTRFYCLTFFLKKIKVNMEASKAEWVNPENY